MLEAAGIVARLVAKLITAIAVIVLVLFALGWVVDTLVDPAEQEITTVQS
jgi:hypothetical protein